MGSTAETINGPTRLSIASGVCFSPATEDGCIVLNVEEGTILSLNDTGALMFAKLAARETGLTRDEFVEAVSCEFEDVDRSRIESAIDNLFRQLDEKRILQRQRPGFRLYGRWLRGKLVQGVAVCIRAVVKPLLIIKAYTPAAVLLLTIADAILKIDGFSSLHRTVKKWKLAVNKSSDAEMIVKGCATVDRACTWHPKQELCLQRSAVAACLLRSLGVPAEMVIGVHKMPFYGHAWVEVGGTVVNDHENVQKFFHVLCRC
jgi:Transglutaminase-like superfamily/Coenzyme PQQ synthesis protein D (PqqD)